MHDCFFLIIREGLVTVILSNYYDMLPSMLMITLHTLVIYCTFFCSILKIQELKNFF